MEIANNTQKRSQKLELAEQKISEDERVWQESQHQDPQHGPEHGRTSEKTLGVKSLSSIISRP